MYTFDDYNSDTQPENIIYRQVHKKVEGAAGVRIDASVKSRAFTRTYNLVCTSTVAALQANTYRAMANQLRRRS